MIRQEAVIPILSVKAFIEILKQRLENGTLKNADDLREVAENTLFTKKDETQS